MLELPRGPEEPREKALAPARIHLEVFTGPDSGRVHASEVDRVTVGAAASNDLVLTSPGVADLHLEIRRSADGFLVRDLGSKTGTFLGRVRINEASVPSGAHLELGEAVVRVTDGPIAPGSARSREVSGPLFGRAPEMRSLIERARKVAATDASVLILGETGTGKEVLARGIHDSSRRAGGPFEVVDCGTLLPTLIASELFGHERGAFTGADRQHTGAFERANGGTLLLDEIGELPPSLQAALLGVLERHSFRRVGGQKPIAVDVRVIASTNRDLLADVAQGLFRADLYYRLAVVSFALPPLRERRGEIPALVKHFLQHGGFRGEVSELISPDVLRGLLEHTWPGNVRELRNFVEGVLITGEVGALGQRSSPASSPSDAVNLSLAELAQLPYKEARSRLTTAFEAYYVRELLKRSGGNVSQAARQARMNRNYLIELVKRHAEDP